MAKTRIEDNWKAIEKIEEKVQQEKGDPEAGFNASTFWLGPRGLAIPLMYRGKKGKRGSEVFTKSYKEIMVMANYCPFTGKPLFKESNQLAEKCSS